MQIGVIGINHKLADIYLREQLAHAFQTLFCSFSTQLEKYSSILLSTCNRTEIYFSSDDLASTHTLFLHLLREKVDLEFDQKLYSYFGIDCFMHLARVTTGLDSAIVVETEIQGQVKKTYEERLKESPLPEELHYLFQKSLKIGKELRSKLPLKQGLPDLEHAVYQAGSQFFKKEQNPKILFIGASSINHKILRYLCKQQKSAITLCNRSLSQAEQLAKVHSLEILLWKDLVHWPHYDWIICGTKSPQNILLTNHLFSAKEKRTQLIIDLGMPRNVDPMLTLQSKIKLLNLDQIMQTLKKRREVIADTLIQAEHMIYHSIRDQFQLFSQKKERKVLFLAQSA